MPVATSQPAQTAPQRITGCSCVTTAFSETTIASSSMEFHSGAAPQQCHDDQDGNGHTEQPSQHVAERAFLAAGRAAATKWMEESRHDQLPVPEHWPTDRK